MKKIIIITAAVLGGVLLIVLLTRLNLILPGGGAGSSGFTEEGSGPVRFTDKVSLSGIALANGSTEDKYRIRYLSAVDKAYYDGLVRKYGAENVKLKTIVFPLMYVTTGMTIDQLTATGKRYLEIPVQNTFQEDGDTYTFAGSLNDIREANYNLAFVGYGIIEINGGEIRYYPKEFDLESSAVFRSAAVSAITGEDGTKTVSLRYYASCRAESYNRFAEEYGADRVCMKLAYCPMDYVKEAGGETLEKLDLLKHAPNYTVEDCNSTKETVNDVVYSFYTEVSPIPESDLGQKICPIGFLEITDSTGAVLRRIYR